jgi:hypothetical protein
MPQNGRRREQKALKPLQDYLNLFLGNKTRSFLKIMPSLVRSGLKNHATLIRSCLKNSSLGSMARRHAH